MAQIDVCPATAFMPDGLRDLEAEARAAGVNNVTALVERWVDGSERFEAPGEALLVAPRVSLIVLSPSEG